MEKNEVVRLFNTKIRLEQKRFERSIKKLGTEKMYDKAYMITCRMNICESLLQKSADMDLEILQCLLVVPDVIRMFYIRWMPFINDEKNRICITGLNLFICSFVPSNFQFKK